ncbi:microtubule-binding protein BIM1 Ecym_1259 [Eremothecium cymbalariae DBVPG|uniref:Calponin-homology (CH) domain-containing protein n=1 Tax=Eremothecium cymbalariae (strain CBS 270.75 / DBVPG 7215 / KCTC 17166 / NRRL Y-17582) TaxID=931890 RepID=G8JN37_ERECY|nr:hypothetical protein Ecym_1259 [Eremothecium cymbalariae DBVPG\
MSGLGESRTELLSWLNDLLRLDYTKVEQCGTGAAYCQIMDSIYGDLPMHRVKFDARAEYESLTNFKILQSCFTKHKIEKTVFVDRLVKCRFQDNLEFLQWLKKFWAQNKDESMYDPVSRRKSARPLSMRGPVSVQQAAVQPAHKRRSLASYPSSNTAGMSSAGSNAKLMQKVRQNGVNSIAGNNGGNEAGLGIGVVAATRVSSGGTRRPAPIAQSPLANEQMAALKAELRTANGKIEKMNEDVTQFQDAITIMERERDFYFGKLRDIEILVQSTHDLFKEGVYNDDPQELNRLIGKINQILYSTEEGFEGNHSIDGSEGIEDAGERVLGHVTDGVPPAQNLITDDETF